MTSQSILHEATYWEQIAATRWGSYISDIEATAIRKAAGRCNKPTEALEVGCEGGRWSRMLTDAGWAMTCTDICERKLAACRRRVPEANCLLADANQPRFPVPDDCCDLLVAIEVPISDESWFAEEVARVLRPNGIVVATFNNRASYRGWLSNLLSGVRYGESFYRSSYAESAARLETCGFRIVEQTGYCWMPFGRASNSRPVSPLTQCERRFGLRERTKFAPWIAVVAERVAASGVTHAECEESR